MPWEGSIVVEFSCANLASLGLVKDFLLVYFEVIHQIQVWRERFWAFAATENAIRSDDSHVLGFDVIVELKWTAELKSALITNGFDFLFVIFQMIFKHRGGRENLAANVAFKLHFACFGVCQQVVRIWERFSAFEACVFRWSLDDHCVGCLCEIFVFVQVSIRIFISSFALLRASWRFFLGVVFWLIVFIWINLSWPSFPLWRLCRRFLWCFWWSSSSVVNFLDVHGSNTLQLAKSVLRRCSLLVIVTNVVRFMRQLNFLDKVDANLRLHEALLANSCRNRIRKRLK